jgi:polar amino acid transport system permease protein
MTSPDTPDTALQPNQPKKKGLTRRQRRSLSRGAQYVVFVAAVIAFAVTADWDRLANQFAQADIAEQMFPEVITLALKNTVLYTLSGFAVGLVLGMVIALMRLSSVGPYRWLAGVYIEIFRGLPALLIFIFIGVAPARRSSAAPTARWPSRSAWSPPPTWRRPSARASRPSRRARWKPPARWASPTRGP